MRTRADVREEYVSINKWTTSLLVILRVRINAMYGGTNYICLATWVMKIIMRGIKRRHILFHLTNGTYQGGQQRIYRP